MADKTTIEWTDATWNPVTGCTKVSPGCDHCYAEVITNRFKRGPFEHVRLHSNRLDEPTHWKKPRMIFVCSMGDLFHSAVPWPFIAEVFLKMIQCPQHTFQVLTKRPGRMAYFAKTLQGFYEEGNIPEPWPPNVWAGTSVESQKYAPRLDVLAKVPAKVRFVSVEPLLGPVDLWPYLGPGWKCNSCYWEGFRQSYGSNDGGDPSCPKCGATENRPIYATGRIGKPHLERTPACLSWVIAGGESGPKARPMHPDWIRQIRNDCQAAGVPFFMKQDSGPRAGLQGRISDDLWSVKEFPNAD